MRQITRKQYQQELEKINEYEIALKNALAAVKQARRSDGDASENSALDAAEHNVTVYNDFLQKARRNIEDVSIVTEVSTEFADIFTLVTVEDINGNQFVYSLVEDGLGGLPNKVSVGSPFGKAIKGSRVGQTFSYIDVASIPRYYKVINIESDV